MARSDSPAAPGSPTSGATSVDKDPQWRDTMVRVEGEAAAALNGTFAENWLEASGEVLVAPEYYPSTPGTGQTSALVVTSTPMAGRSTEARVFFQALFAKAGAVIHITNPYFLPDKSLREELVKAVKRGRRSDHPASRARRTTICSPGVPAARSTATC